jgi:hypothetical protein
MTDAVRNGLIWATFGMAVLVATMPMWRFWIFGFNPTLDELLSIMCTSR